MRVGQTPLQFSPHIHVTGDRLAMQFIEPWLVLEGVHLRNPALHEDEDAVLGLAGKIAQPRSQRIGRPEIGRRTQFVGHYRAKSHRPETIERARKKLPAGPEKLKR